VSDADFIGLVDMPPLTYFSSMSPTDKPLVWLHGEVKTPPFSPAARIEAGVLLRRLQRGEMLSLPHSRPMPSISGGCHELRIRDEDAAWRIIYRLDPDAIIIAEVFQKATQQTPKHVIDTCKRRLSQYDRIVGGEHG
jgi:phage-related protein